MITIPDFNFFNSGYIDNRLIRDIVFKYTVYDLQEEHMKKLLSILLLFFLPVLIFSSPFGLKIGMTLDELLTAFCTLYGVCK